MHNGSDTAVSHRALPDYFTEIGTTSNDAASGNFNLCGLFRNAPRHKMMEALAYFCAHIFKLTPLNLSFK
jgi:hypothetical protein